MCGRASTTPPGSEVDADEHDRPAVRQPVVDLVGFAREPACVPVLAREAHEGALYLGRDGESLDLLLSVYEFDLAVDSEVTHGGIPDVPGVGHHLVHERLGAEAGPLLDAPPRHRQPRRREANPGSGAPLARSRPHCSRGALSAARHLRWQVRW